MAAETMEPIGLIGVGLVGSALAEHLLARGYPVVGYDRDAGRQRWLRDQGGRTADCPAAVADSCRRIVLSLLTSAVVLEVVEGPRGLLSAATRPQTIIDTTTTDPEQTECLAARLRQHGVALVEATISGSSRQIRERQALFLTAGDPAAVTAAADLLAAMAERTLYVGPSGSAARAKLATNLVLGLNRLALAEGLVFAECLGLDLTAFLDILRASPATSAAVDSKGAKMIAADFAPESRVRQHRKDLTLIMDYASRCGQSLPLAQVHLDVLDRLIEDGAGEQDTAAVICELRRRARHPAKPASAERERNA
jgi:3-hydroxyisobutyrate dehydrogenase-like beta-hydroxyacid dehydrogenase